MVGEEGRDGLGWASLKEVFENESILNLPRVLITNRGIFVNSMKEIFPSKQYS